MSHASATTLHRIAGLLAELRALPELTERSAAVFYRKRQPFLHFHEYPDGLVADTKVDGEWVRHPLDGKTAERRLLAYVRRQVKQS